MRLGAGGGGMASAGGVMEKDGVGAEARCAELRAGNEGGGKLS